MNLEEELGEIPRQGPEPEWLPVTRTAGCSRPGRREGGRQGGGVKEGYGEGGREASAQQWDRYACQEASSPSPGESQLSLAGQGREHIPISGGRGTKVASCAKILVPGCLIQLHITRNRSVFLRSMRAVNAVTRLFEQFLNSQILWACDSMNASVIL